MAKSPFFNPNPNPNPTHTNSSSRKQFNHQMTNGNDHDFNPADAASFNRRASPSFSHYVSFDISAYSKADLYKLKLQLISELHKIRTLSNRIEKPPSESKKRPSPFPQINPNGKQQHLTPPSPPYAASPALMKMCSTVLKKLSSQKAGSWFNVPVDAEAMRLHDYHTVIDRPMDLGTIRKKMDKGTYLTPDDFAADVRLTFNNALRYNPKGHEVHKFAEEYLMLFERSFQPVFAKYQAEKQLHFHQFESKKRNPPPPPPPVSKPIVVAQDEVQESSWCKLQSPEPPKVVNAAKKPVEPKAKPKAETPPREVVPVVAPPPVVERSGGRGRPPEGKLPKPKAKEPNKRAMSMEEKQKLGAGLQSLPEEKMSQVIHIIRKRNGPLDQDGDEIELDIEAVDVETLWELDRFVTNYKKMVSKIKRQSLLGPVGNNVGLSDDTNQAGMSDRMVEMSSKGKKSGGGGGDVGEEDVDIGDEMPVNNFPPLEIDKDDDRQHGGGGGGGGVGGGGGASSSSSSSSSDDSSSSGSDSGSSSGSDSDVDDAQSRDKESKNFQN